MNLSDPHDSLDGPLPHFQPVFFESNVKQCVMGNCCKYTTAKMPPDCPCLTEFKKPANSAPYSDVNIEFECRQYSSDQKYLAHALIARKWGSNVCLIRPIP